MYAKYESIFYIRTKPNATIKELAELMDLKLRQVSNVKNKYKSF